MPSGTVVTAQHICPRRRNCRLDVVVFPLAEDFDHSEGLCGNFNGRKDDDRVPKGSDKDDDRKEPIAFAKSWMSVAFYLAVIRLTLRHPLLPYWYSYKASCARSG